MRCMRSFPLKKRMVWRKRKRYIVLCILLTGCLSQGIPSQDTTYTDLFAIPWDDLTVFSQGLVDSEIASLNLLQEASVYHIDIHISTDCRLLQGHETVCYTNQENEPLQTIYFRLFPTGVGGKTTVSSVQVNETPAEFFYEYMGTALNISLEKPLLPHETVIIDMDFLVDVPTEMSGHYGLFGYYDEILLCDTFYPVIPVYDDEQWNIDLPSFQGDNTYFDASFYLVKITAPASLTIVSAGIEIDRSETDTEQTVAVVAGPARDFYFAASEHFHVISSTVGETTINSYAPDSRKEEALHALEIGINALLRFSERVGDYPYTEYDIVSIPMLARGIEYPGIVGISQDLYDPDAVISGLPSSVLLESVIAHETAHQWFYNVVGNDQINEPWLDEALAQFFTYVYYVEVQGRDAADQYRSSWNTSWELIQSEDIPIGLPVDAYEGNQYVPIIYGRGPLFMQALAEKMGEELFYAFLRAYYESHKWNIGTTEAFKTLAESYCDCNLSPLFEEWVYAKSKNLSCLQTFFPLCTWHHPY